MNNIEIELRYELENSAQIDELVKSLRLLNTKRVIDIYLDTIDGDLSHKGIYIRIRNNQKLEIKFNRACLEDPMLERQFYCEEYPFLLPLTDEALPKLNQITHEIGLHTINIPTLEEYKRINHLIDHRIVDKIRTSYQHDTFIISVDQVKNLGVFLEIELMAHDVSDLEKTRIAMENLLKNFNLKPLKTGYDALILKKQNFQQYLRSRFALPEDKARYGE